LINGGKMFWAPDSYRDAKKWVGDLPPALAGG